jgi:hypothetical protein
MTQNNNPLPNIKLALIIDGEVVDILHAHDRLAAILLSEPTVVEITDANSEANSAIYPGWTYDKKTKKFTPPIVGS